MIWNYACLSYEAISKNADIYIKFHCLEVNPNKWCSRCFRTLELSQKLIMCLCFSKGYTIQIKICEEYRDMLPRPRLVCQEPGLRPIGRSPGAPDKSSRGLGSMSRYSAQILICFIAYIFFNFQFLCGFGWEPCRTATMHSAPCHCSLLSEWGCSVLIRQSNLPACLAEGQQEETLSGIHATELVKLADKMDEICISRKFSVQEPSKWRFLLHTCE